MTEEQIIACLERLGCRKIRTRGDEVWSTCPNEGAHHKGVDNNPSFSVRIEPTDASPCGCFACDEVNTKFENLVTRRGIPGFAKKGRARLYKPDEWMEMPPDNRGVFGTTNEAPFFPPESALDMYKGRAHRTILDRGFTLDTCKAWELGYDGQADRAIFVTRDIRGRLRGISGRATKEGQQPKYLHYSWDAKVLRLTPWVDHRRKDDFEKFEKRLVLYGEHMVDWERVVPEVKFIVICEGPTDVLWLWQAGYVAVAVQGSAISLPQITTLLELLPRNYGVMIGADNDTAGRKFASNLREHLAGKVPLFLPAWPDGKDPASTPVGMLPELFRKAKAQI